jgi:hypothetical protein
MGAITFLPRVAAFPVQQTDQGTMQAAQVVLPGQGLALVRFAAVPGVSVPSHHSQRQEPRHTAAPR